MHCPFKGASVTVVSIYRRGDPEIQDCIDNVNTAVLGICDDLSCTYCDTTNIVRLTDGTINEGFYLDDLHHSTHKGQNKASTDKYTI